MGGGPKDQIPDLDEFKNGQKSLWIGVDRGTRYLLEEGIVPDIAIGDFDSITYHEFLMLKETGSEVKKFHTEKDETDMELAIQKAYEYKPSIIKIFGATGGRLDHLIANINLLYQYLQNNDKVHTEIIDKQNIATIKNPGVYKLEN